MPLVSLAADCSSGHPIQVCLPRDPLLDQNGENYGTLQESYTRGKVWSMLRSPYHYKPCDTLHPRVMSSFDRIYPEYSAITKRWSLSVKWILEGIVKVSQDLDR